MNKLSAKTRLLICFVSGALLAASFTGCGPGTGTPPAPGSEDWNRLMNMLDIFEEITEGIPTEEYYLPDEPRPLFPLTPDVPGKR